MNRSELIEKMCDLYPKLSAEIIDSTIKSMFINMADNLAKGERIEIRSFGCFATKVRRSNIIRNPRDGSIIARSGPKHLIYFRPSKEFKEKVNI
jgi:integration host factor subunit beta